MKDQNEPRDVFEGARCRDALNPAATLMLGYNACFWSFIRRGMGPNALAVAGPVALLIMFTFVGVGNCPQMTAYMGLWVLACLYQRLNADRTQHSRYPGWPALTCFAFGTRDEGRAKLLEAALVGFAGVLVYQYIPNLGMFVAGGGLSLLTSEVSERWVGVARARRMHDANVVQRQAVEQYRRGGW